MLLLTQTHKEVEVCFRHNSNKSGLLKNSARSGQTRMAFTYKRSDTNSIKVITVFSPTYVCSGDAWHLGNQKISKANTNTNTNKSTNTNTLIFAYKNKIDYTAYCAAGVAARAELLDCFVVLIIFRIEGDRQPTTGADSAATAALATTSFDFWLCQLFFGFVFRLLKLFCVAVCDYAPFPY